MSKRANGNGGGRSNLPSTSSVNSSSVSGVNRKHSIINTPNRVGGGGLSFEPKGEKTEYAHNAACKTNLSMSSLKTRLAPTIRTTLSAAVDTLLGEVVLVLSETQQELVTKAQENESLKVRLEVSERELKTLQECLCSAQKLIDQLQGPFGGHSTFEQQVYPPPPGQGVDRARLTHRHDHESDARCFAGAEAEMSGPLGDTLHGFDSRDEFKNCHLSIQADGTVTNHLFDSLPVNAPNICSDVNRDVSSLMGRRPSQSEAVGPGRGPQARFTVKEEQGPGVVQGSELSAQSVGDLGYIHVVEEEGGSRPLSHPSKPGRAPPSGPRHGASGTPPPQGLGVARKTPPAPGRAPSPGRAGDPAERPAASDLMGGAGDPSAERPHLCLECGKTFRLISSLKKHIRIHTGEKPYPCAVCGRRFRESGALKTHLRIHTGEKPYACAECGTRFRHLDGLRKHRRTHTGEKPYGCSVCGKRLSRLQHLKHHQRIHTGERPCTCPLCPRGFKDPAGLRKHLRTHQGEPGAGGAPGEGPRAPGPEGPASPPSVGFGMWGEEVEEDGEEDSVADCV